MMRGGFRLRSSTPGQLDIWVCPSRSNGSERSGATFFPNPGVENLLGVFKGRYPIVLLSNTNEMHFQHLVERFDVLGLPDRFILSYRIGCSKPDPRIYQAAIEAAGHSGDVCVYIDDIPDYVQAASRQGMHGIVFRTAEELQMDLAALGLSFE